MEPIKTPALPSTANLFEFTKKTLVHHCPRWPPRHWLQVRLEAELEEEEAAAAAGDSPAIFPGETCTLTSPGFPDYLSFWCGLTSRNVMKTPCRRFPASSP